MNRRCPWRTLPQLSSVTRSDFSGDGNGDCLWQVEILFLQEFLDDSLVLQSTNEAFADGNVEVPTEVTVKRHASKFCDVSSHRLAKRLVSLVKAIAFGNGERGRGKMLSQRGGQLVEAFRLRIGWGDQVSDELVGWFTNQCQERGNFLLLPDAVGVQILL